VCICECECDCVLDVTWTCIFGGYLKPFIVVISAGTSPFLIPKTKSSQAADKCLNPKHDTSIVVLFVLCFHTRTSVFCGVNSLKELRVRIGIAVRIWIALGVR